MNDKGQALIIITVFIAFILSVSVGAAEYSLRSRQTGKRLTSQLAAQNLAEAGVHKAIWCLNQSSGANCGGTYGIGYTGESNVDMTVGTFTTTVTVTGFGSERNIISTGTASDGTKRKVSVTASATPAGTNFNLTLGSQAGQGGINMSNNSAVIGSVYANGPINCGNGASVTGDATVAYAAGKIDGCAAGGTAKAHTIKSSTVTGDAYYQTITSSTVAGTKYPGSPDPPPLAFSVTDAQVASMKNDAAAGGVISGDYSPSGSVSLGPKHITGNLILNGSGILTVTGTIWVSGHISIDNGAGMLLSPLYGANSGTVLADGFINLKNNGNFAGSGNPNSFLMIMSEATGGGDNNAAIDLHNNVTGAIFYARNGDVNLENNVNAQQITANRIVLQNNATVTFNNNIISTTFTAGSNGIWRAKKGTWAIIP